LKAFLNNNKWSIVIILFVVFIIYGRTVKYQFVIDDKTVITQNKFVQKGLGGVKDIITTSYWEGYAEEVSSVYRPLPLISFALTKQLFGDKSTPHHVLNILIWYVSLLLLLYIIQFNIVKEKSRWISLFLVLIYAVLPTNVEVVASIKGRDDLLCLLFSLIGIYYYFKHLELKKIKYILYACLSLLMAFLSKETAIIFILVLPIFSFYSNLNTNQKLKNVGILLITFIIGLGIRYSIVHDSAEVLSIENNMVLAFSGIEKLFFKLYLLLMYHVKVIYPINLTWDYSLGFFEVKNYLIEGIISLLVLISSAIIVIKGIINKKKYAPFLVWFYSGILLTSNLFFLTGSTFAERFLFIPSIGLILSLYFLLSSLFKKMEYLKYIFIVLGLFYGVLSFSRVQDWKDEETLINADYNKTSKSYRTELAYADNIIKDAKSKGNINQEDNIQVNEILTSLILRFPEVEQIYIVSGSYYNLIGNVSKAIEVYEKAIKINGNSYLALLNLGFIYEKDNISKAKEMYFRATKVSKQSHIPFSNLGMILHAEGNYLEAKKYYEESLIIYPNNTTIIQNLTNVNNAINIENAE
jgi:tetratricopeptide (TPR) repeat protein